MTAMNLVVQEKVGATYLLTDTAVYNSADGSIHSFWPKVTGVAIGEDGYAAVATSGGMFFNHIQPHIAEMKAPTLREFIDAFPAAFRAGERASRSEGGKGPMAAVVAVCNRRTGKAAGYGIANGTVLWGGRYRPYTMMQMSRHLTDFNPDHYPHLVHTEFCDPGCWNPERDGVALMEAQRADPFDFGIGIGGQAILTRVDQSGITHKVIRAWGDWPFQPIDLIRGDKPGLLGHVRAKLLMRNQPPRMIEIGGTVVEAA